MKNYRPLFIVITVLNLGGCAAYQLEPLATNHPAHPDALAAPKPSQSKTLAYTKADIPSAHPMVATPQERPDSAMSKSGPRETVIGEGNVIATVPNADQLVIDHGRIEGFMDAMTMGYRIEPRSLLEGLKSGDRIRFTIDVQKKSIVKIEKLRN